MCSVAWSQSGKRRILAEDDYKGVRNVGLTSNLFRSTFYVSVKLWLDLAPMGPIKEVTISYDGFSVSVFKIEG